MKSEWFLYQRDDGSGEKVKIEEYADFTNRKGYYILGVYPEDGFSCGIRNLTDEQYKQIIENDMLVVHDQYGFGWSLKKLDK